MVDCHHPYTKKVSHEPFYKKVWMFCGSALPCFPPCVPPCTKLRPFHLKPSQVRSGMIEDCDYRQRVEDVEISGNHDLKS